MDTNGTTNPAQTQDSPVPSVTPTVTTEKPLPRSPNSRTRYITTVEGPSATDTSHGNDTDINKIVARFDRTGQLPDGKNNGQYVDCTPFNRDLTDLLDHAQDIQTRAKEFIEQWSPTPEEPEQQTTTEPAEQVPTP